MATRTAKLRVELDGEREYKQAISELNKGNQVLASEMRKLSEEYKGNEKSTEALSAKSDVLQRQLQQQKDKVETLREALANAAQQYGESDRRTQDWQIQLNNAEAAQAKLEHQLDETNEEIAQQGTAMAEDSGQMKSFGDSIDKIAGELGIKLPDGAKKALDGMSGLSAGTVAAMAGIAAAVAVAVKAVKELYDMAVESAEKVDELEARAMKTGIDAGLLQQIDYAQRFLDFDNLDSTLVKLTQNMGKATEGANDQSAAFERLGVSVTNADGSMRDSWDVFVDTIDALGTIRNETERDITANALFGKSYAEMKPLVEAGSGALKDYMAQAEKLGIVLDEEERAKLAELSDVLEDNEARWEALKDKISMLVAPAISDIIGFVNDLITSMTHLAGVIDDVDWSKLGTMSNSAEYGFGIGGGSISDATAAMEPYFEALRYEDELTQAAQRAEEAYRASVEETAAAQEAAGQRMQEALQALAEEYQKAYEAAYSSLDGQFGLWEKVEEVTATSASSMNEALQSQLDYWKEYGSNFESLMSRNIEGIEGFAENFMDGSKESAEALAGLKDASDEEIRQIIDKMAETDQAKEDMAARFAALQTDLEGTLGEIKDNYESTMSDLQTATDDVDFSGFDAAVDTTFSNLEWRAESAVAYVQAQLAQLQASMSSIEGARVGRNAGGTENWRGGLTWVGEAGPELVNLPRGSQVMSAQESREIGGQNIVINVQGIQQLDEIVRWYDSRRIVGRMM